MMAKPLRAAFAVHQDQLLGDASRASMAHAVERRDKTVLA
jgi:hypothetical protein